MIKAATPDISQQFLEELVRNHPQLTIDTKSQMNDIMYNAGQQSVINWIKSRVPKQTLAELFGEQV